MHIYNYIHILPAYVRAQEPHKEWCCALACFLQEESQRRNTWEMDCVTQFLFPRQASTLESHFLPTTLPYRKLHQSYLYQMQLTKPLKEPRTLETRQAGDSFLHLHPAQLSSAPPGTSSASLSHSRHQCPLPKRWAALGFLIWPSAGLWYRPMQQSRLGLCPLHIKCLVLIERRAGRRTYHNIVKVDLLKIRVVVLYSFQSFFHVR